MIKILANDGISEDGKLILEDAGFQVDTERISQEALVSVIAEYDAIIVRTATKVTKELIDAATNLKVIARAGEGTDSIDVEYAESKGICVLHTPEASALSVAELVFGHLFAIARNLHKAQRAMPSMGSSSFKELKKAYSDGMELRGKTIGILGFGRVGQAVARIALGLGMNILAVDVKQTELKIDLPLLNTESLAITVTLRTVSLREMLQEADIVTVHVPFKGGSPTIGRSEIALMKKGVIIINAARGGVVDELALLEALESGKVRGAGIDVFEREPMPRPELLQHPKVSATPHIGASTLEAQAKIGLELADQIIAFFGA